MKPSYIMKHLTTPITDEDLASVNVGDQISISGTIYTGRDAALPQLVRLIEENNVPFDLNGSAIMHTAFSDAGIAPTTSSIFVITPPVASLLTNKVVKKECVLFENEGMEAMFKLEVEKIPGIVAIHNGKKIK